MMRILDEENDRRLNHVTIFLTKAEAIELQACVKNILSEPASHHEHLPDREHKKEITVCIYDENKLDGFSERARKLINEDS
jgi:hypothetical protein